MNKAIIHDKCKLYTKIPMHLCNIDVSGPSKLLQRSGLVPAKRYFQPRLFSSQTVFPASSTGETPPERRTIHVIFADPILVAMECVSVSSSSGLKQDVRSCVRSVKIQKLLKPLWSVINETDTVAISLATISSAWTRCGVVLGRNVVGGRLLWRQRSF